MSIQSAINQGLAIAGALYSQSAQGAVKKLEKENEIKSNILEKQAQKTENIGVQAISEYERLAKEQGAKQKDIKAGIKAIQEQVKKNQAQLLEKRATLGDVESLKGVATQAQKESEILRKQEQANKRALKKQLAADNQQERTSLWINAGKVGEMEFQKLLEQYRGNK